MIGLIGPQLAKLPDMQRKVLALYYFEDLRLREIAEVFGLTQSRICQIHLEAIRAIKSLMQNNDSLIHRRKRRKQRTRLAEAVVHSGCDWSLINDRLGSN